MESKRPLRGKRRRRVLSSCRADARGFLCRRCAQDRDESDNFNQKYDPELVKDELRPIVFEEIRQQVGNIRFVHPAAAAMPCTRRGPSAGPPQGRVFARTATCPEALHCGRNCQPLCV